MSPINNINYPNNINSPGKKRSAGSVLVIGSAYFECGGQSNALGFNQVDDLDVSKRKVYTNVEAYSITAGAGTSTPTVEKLAYILSGNGENIGGVGSSRYGERNLGAAQSGGIGPTFSLVKEFDAGNMWSNATDVIMAKAATSGQHIDEFRPIKDDSTIGGTWKNLNHGRRSVRAYLAASPLEELLYQCKIWLQGEANTSAPRAAANLLHPDIVDYGSDFEEVYSFDEAQLTVQPIWFLVQISKDGNSVGDVYNAAINAELKKLCRYTVNASSGLYTNITDNANGGNTKRYFVEHNIVNGVDVHWNATQMEQISDIIAAALQDIYTDGYTDDYEITEVKPVIMGQTSSVSTNAITINAVCTDNGTLYAAAVPATSPAPTNAQIIAGTGGGIVSANSASATNSTAGGGNETVTVTGLGFSTAYDVYCVLVEGVNSVESNSKKSTETTEALVLEFDTDFQSANITYTNSNKTAANGTGASRYPRTVPTQSAGKIYFEIVASAGTIQFAGVGHVGAPTAGGSNGTDRCGWLFSNLQYTGGSQAMGANVNSASVIQVCVDLDTDEIWVRADGTGNWNNTSGDDPATGVGGRDISGMPSAINAMVGLAQSSTATVALETIDWTYTAPSGFGEIGA